MPAAPIFFTDRDLGRHFPELLRSAGLNVERHVDHFSDSAPDEEWIAAVAERGWIAITHDKRISRRPNEREAVFRAGLGLLIVVGAAPHAELATSFIATLPRIASFLGKHDPPFIARVYRPTPADVAKKRHPVGRVELWVER